MSMKDTLQLSNWINSRVSLADVESVDRYGLVGNERFTESARRAYRLIWEWSAHRFGGSIGARQEMLWNRHGRDFVERRIARCKARIEKLKD